MVMFNLRPRMVTTRRSSAGALPAKTAVINGGNGWALAAVLLPPLKVGINGGFVTAVKKTATKSVFNDGNETHF